MNRMRFTKAWRHLLWVLTAVAVTATPSFAVDYYLVAKEFTQTMPDGLVVPMWGFAEDVGGTCYWTTPIAARVICAQGLTATAPGPRLTVGATVSTLRILLTNILPEPVSILIPGQEMPFSANDSGGPTWNSGQVGPRPDATARVRSFGREAAANGGRRNYVWANSRDNPLRAGTFVYQSGTSVGKQVHMGLYGAVTKDSSAGAVYGYPYNRDVVLFYSEIDPNLHNAAQFATPLNYQPRYFLVNGQPYPGNQMLPGLQVGSRVLLRFLNAGLQTHSPTLGGGLHVDVVAEDGNAHPFPSEQYSLHLTAGKTIDALLTVAEEGEHAVYDRVLALSNNGSAASTGGMMSFLTGAAVGPVLDFSTLSGGVANAVPGVAAPYNNADVYRWDGAVFSRLWSAVSQLGLPGGANVDGLAEVDADTLCVSFTADGILVPGLVAPVNDEDVVCYDIRTNAWTLFFDGSAAGLNDTIGGTDLDAIDIVGGVLYFSTLGSGGVASNLVPGVPGPYDNADIYTWDGTAFGRAFDAVTDLGLPPRAIGEVRLTENSLNVDGLTVIDANTLYVSFLNDGSVVTGTLTVADEDVVEYAAGVWSLYFDGAAHGLNASNGQDVDAIDVH